MGRWRIFQPLHPRAAERKAEAAFAELKTKSNLRLSSLIKNDAELMEAAREIAESSAAEWDHLRAL